MDSLALTFLQKGKVSSFASHLKSYFVLQGVIIRGKNYGSSINFPTINLLFLSTDNLPKLGCYLTLIAIDKQYYPGLTCLIEHPQNKAIIACETHLQHFNRDVYGETVQVFFLEFFRDNVPFALWQANHQQIIAQDLKQWEKNLYVQRQWCPSLPKNAKIVSNFIHFSN